MRGLCWLLAVLLLSACTAPSGEQRGEDLPPVSAKSAPEAAFSASPEAEPPAPPVPEVPEAPVPPPELPDGEFARVTDYIPGLVVDLRYAGPDNFTGQAVYEFTDAYLRYGTIQKLAAVQAALEEEGMGLKLWDAFRPAGAQFALWEICPDSRYVADPNKGYSSHSRGNTVDLTLVDREGGEVEMPTDFDDFSARADRDYSDVPPEAAENARRLEDAMTAGGFRPYFGEWWHYSDTESYQVEEDFQPPADKTGGDGHG